ncbi:MAG: family 1 glycosylhydrolase, partial [Anaerolineae bacterium]|nr:family 1 glycosylhydrolase [Anaerolineae bacterium]
GLQAYRLSLSWPRILPEGVGRVNAAGLGFYDRLVDELLAAGIDPYITLFHWDYPYELYCRGGWLNPDSSDWFAEYAAVVADKLGDRVKYWMTHNEPAVFVVVGHRDGRHAPGLKLSFNQILRMSHNVQLAHGKAVQALRARVPEAKIGAAIVSKIAMPATEQAADIEAARRFMFEFKGQDLWHHNWWSDPMLRGEYPADALALFDGLMPEIKAGDMETIHQPLDFYGVNIYNGAYVRAGADGEPEVLPQPMGFPITAFHWPVTPEALYWGPRFLWERYGLPIVITENGLANTDWVALDGKVHDPQRIDFTGRYLLNYQRAAADGVKLHGYFHWSVMDNFEWGEGTKHRFGLIHVDYETGRRTLKDSAYWYSNVIKSNGASLA